MLAHALALQDDQRMTVDGVQHGQQRRTALDRDPDRFDRRHGRIETAADGGVAVRRDVVADHGAVRTLGRRFRHDPAAYLRSLEESLIKQDLPP